MQFYFAPLEGITGFAYRNVHRQFFGEEIDKYFSPFAAPNYTHNFKTREREDIDPANNEGVRLVPQILTNRAGDFLWAAKEMYEMGYREINLNLGCPMPTVVKKGRGSGQLGDLDALDLFLEEICEGMHLMQIPPRIPDSDFDNSDSDRCDPDNSDSERCDSGNCRFAGCDFDKRGYNKSDSVNADEKLRFTVKTRIGFEDAGRAEALLDIYNRYPIWELTVHPRTQRDLYGGTPDLETFSMFLEKSTHPVVYNGDIFSLEDYEKIRARFPECGAVMIGRGLIADPALARELRGGALLQKEELRSFHDAVYESLKKTLPGQAPLMGKMKELWFYMGRNFDGADRFLKEIRKAKNEIQYRAAVRTLFVNCRLKAEV